MRMLHLRPSAEADGPTEERVAMDSGAERGGHDAEVLAGLHEQRYDRVVVTSRPGPTPGI